MKSRYAVLSLLALALAMTPLSAHAQTQSQDEIVKCPQCRDIANQVNSMERDLATWDVFSRTDFERMGNNLIGDYLGGMKAIDRDFDRMAGYAAKNGDLKTLDALEYDRSALRISAKRLEAVVRKARPDDMDTRPFVKEILDSQADLSPFLHELNEWASGAIQHNRMIRTKNALLRDINAFTGETANGMPSANQ